MQRVRFNVIAHKTLPWPRSYRMAVELLQWVERGSLKAVLSSRQQPELLTFQLPLSIFGFATLLASVIYPFFILPAEDALILHQYSRNLADTGIISFIHNGPRAEGATDFLWMVYIALGLKLHISTAISTVFANVASATGLAFVLFRLAGRKFSWLRFFAIFGVLGLLPQTQAALCGFSVLPFSFAIALTTLLLEEERDGLAAFSALVLCLLRPDGVVFAIPLILRSLALKPTLRRSAIFLSGFILPGTIYFLWRWSYFHHFLPLPFLVKSDTHRVLGIFAPGSQSSVRYFLFSLMVILCSLGRRIRQSRQLSLFIVLVILPTLFYSAMRLDQNIYGRFYVYLPLAAALILARNWDDTAVSHRNLAWIAILFYSLLLGPKTVKAVMEYRQLRAAGHSGQAFGREIGALRPRGTMLVSEAGFLPYFSEWAAYDSWGLNTEQYAIQLIQPKDVVELYPDLIMLHPERADVSCAAEITQPESRRTWENMTLNVQSGIAMLGRYETWREAIGDAKESVNAPHAVLCWYISPRYSQHEELAAILKRLGAQRQP